MFDMDYMARRQAVSRQATSSSRKACWKAIHDHAASPTFDEDVETHWTVLPFPTEAQTQRATRWVNGTAGESLFQFGSRIQLNEQMGNAPEPDTKHFLNRDLYTHIKWGRMSPLETDEDGWLGGQSQEFVVGDSMFVGGILLTVDSLRAIRDDERPGRGLLDDDLALAHASA